MKRRPQAPGVEARTTFPLVGYRQAPRRDRLHVRMRWLTCPVDAITDLVPRAGDILDWGCGHGLVSLRMAELQSGRTVLGVDLDAAKVEVATQGARAGGLDARASFEVAEPGALPDGSWHGIVIVDVLYLLDAARQEAVVRAAARSLVPGGVLVCKEMARRPRWKRSLVEAQEWLSVRVLAISATEAGLHRPPDLAEVAGWMASEGLEVRTVPLDRGHHVPHAAVVGNRPARVETRGG